MRRLSLVLVVLIAFGGPLASAREQPLTEREARGAFERLTRVVRSIFKIRANGDGLTPPLPAPSPRP